MIKDTLARNTNKSDITIRTAVPADGSGIAKVHAYTWWSSYQSFMPKEYLEDRIINIENATLKFTNCINTKHNCLVAEVGNEIVGILYFMPAKDPKYAKCGEIKGVYVLERFQRMGIGKRLFIAGIKALLEHRYKDMIINVVQANTKGKNFYLKLGGEVVGEFESTFGGVTLKQDVIYYKDIQALYEKLTAKK
ncbi:MAG: GNAT family N-acetyltransferase [Clostridia bacterium]|nr:GNAT family N-acetyltransferase [Clostridia bacterium]